MKYWLPLLTFCAFFPFATVAEEKVTETSETATETQESTPTVQEENPYQSNEEVEKFDVIGSHIKKTQTEGPSPVLVIDRDQIEMSGYNSLADILRDIPVASFGSSSEQSLSQPSSATGTSLRGMGAPGMGEGSILFLINKKRMSTFGGTTNVDLTVIPISVIERVEILKDGASALYGADAIGGVINIVTKRNYVGGQVNIQGSLVQREEGNSGLALASFADFWNWNDEDNAWAGKGDKISIDASYGGNANDINYLVGGQVRLNTPLYLRDRSFGRLASAKDGSTYGSPGSWSDDDKKTWNAAPDCPKENIKKDGKCGFDWSPYMQFTPQVLQASVFGQADKEIMDGVDLSGQVIYSYTRSHSIIAPAPDEFAKPSAPGKPDFRIPAATAQSWGLSASAPVTVLYRLVEEEGSGNRESILNGHFYQTQLSLSTDLMNTMELEGNLNLSGSYYDTTSKGYVNKETLFNMAQAGNFKPFLLSGKKSNIEEASYEPTQVTFSNLISVEPLLTGEVGEIAGQPLSFAVGALGAWQYYSQENDEITKAGKQWGGGVAVDGEGDRLYSSLYGELSAILYEMVDVQLAARTDLYSDFGLAWQDLEGLPLPFSPRVAVSFQPIEEVKLRASWGLGFKVPSLEALHNNEQIDHPSSRDFFRCDEEYIKVPGNKEKFECKSEQYKVYRRSNDKLNPEFSESFNVGLVLEPVDKLAITLDYYRTSQEDIASEPQLRDIFKYEKKHGKEKLQELGLEVKRNPDKTVDHIVSAPANLARYKVQGIDLDVAFSVPVIDGWDLGLRVEHSHILYAERQALEDSDIEVPVPFYDWLGIENGDPNRKDNDTWDEMPRWRNRAMVSFMSKDAGHRFDLIVHNLPTRLQTPESTTDEDSENDYVDYYWQLDLRGTFGLTKKSRLTVGIQNVLGFDRPQRNKAFGTYRPNYSGGVYLNSNFYSMRGRSIDVRYSHDL